jgi:CheY-like chemotaxis protein
VSGKTVLIVDDEPGIVKLVAAVLANSGYGVLEAACGAEALEVATKHSAPIDLLLTDVRMPEMAGPVLCEQMRLRHSETRYLLMSAYAEGFETSGQAFIAKPFSVANLLQAVRNVLDPTQDQPPDPVSSMRAGSPSSRNR